MKRLIVVSLVLLGCDIATHPVTFAQGSLTNAAIHQSVIIGGGPDDPVNNDGGLQIDDQGNLDTSGGMIVEGGISVSSLCAPFNITDCTESIVYGMSMMQESGVGLLAISGYLMASDFTEEGWPLTAILTVYGDTLEAEKFPRLMLKDSIKTFTQYLDDGDVVLDIPSDDTDADFSFVNSGTKTADVSVEGSLTLGNPLATSHGGTGANDISTARDNLGLEIGADVQGYDTELAAIAGLTSAADQFICFTGAGTAGTSTISTAALTVLDDATVSAMLDTLGGESATGSGAVVRKTSPSVLSATLTTPTVSDGLLLTKESATISGGSIAYGTVYCQLDTEGSAATDDLTSVTGGAEGNVLVLKTTDNSRDVVVKYGSSTHQFLLKNNADFTLDNVNDSLTLIRASGAWTELSRTDESDVILSSGSGSLTFLSASANITGTPTATVVYSRVGNTVTGSFAGLYSTDSTVGTVLIQFAPPIASGFTQTNDLSGTAAAVIGTAQVAGHLIAGASSDSITIYMPPPTEEDSYEVFGSFSYIIK